MSSNGNTVVLGKEQLAVLVSYLGVCGAMYLRMLEIACANDWEPCIDELGFCVLLDGCCRLTLLCHCHVAYGSPQ